MTTLDTATADRIAADIHRRSTHLQDRHHSGGVSENVLRELRGELIGLHGALGMALGHTVQDGADKAARDYYQMWWNRQNNGAAVLDGADTAVVTVTATIPPAFRRPAHLAARVRARRDPRYPEVRSIIAAFDWPDGKPMVPGNYADILATRIMAAIVTPEPAPTTEEEPAMPPEGPPGGTRYSCPLPGCTWHHDVPAGAFPDADAEAAFLTHNVLDHLLTHNVLECLTALVQEQQRFSRLEALLGRAATR